MRLREDGNDVESIAQLSPGISDQSVLSRSLSEDCLLLTADKDFGELVYRLGLPYQGILLYRLEGLSNQERASRISATIQKYGQRLLGAFSVLSERNVRVRASARI